MTVEERLQQMIGVQAFQIASLATQLEQSQKKIEELEKKLKDGESVPE